MLGAAHPAQTDLAEHAIRARDRPTGGDFPFPGGFPVRDPVPRLVRTVHPALVPLLSFGAVKGFRATDTSDSRQGRKTTSPSTVSFG